MSIESEDDLKGLRRAGRVAAEALATMSRAVRPGITTAELDAICGRVFAKHGAESAPRRMYNAPCQAFVSVNDEVVHGLPGLRPLRPGDVVKLDVTPILDGYVADTAKTVVVPPASRLALRLIACAEQAFQAAMREARAGRPIHVIGRAVEREVKRHGFTVLRALSGHGVGRAIHELPEVFNLP